MRTCLSYRVGVWGLFVMHYFTLESMTFFQPISGSKPHLFFRWKSISKDVEKRGTLPMSGNSTLTLLGEGNGIRIKIGTMW